MRISNLNDVFKVVAAKYLSAVDAEPDRSNQHEVGGLSSLKESWGEIHSGMKIPCNFLYLGDNDEDHIQYTDQITWYDARNNNPDRSPEWRIYYPSNPVSEKMSEGDLLIVSKDSDGKAIFIVSKSRSGNTFQLLNLFQIERIKARGFTDNSRIFDEDIPLDFSSRFILDNLGFEYDYSDESFLDIILARFGDSFPRTFEFSEFTRSTVSEEAMDLDNPDDILILWMDREELLFKTLENKIVSERLDDGFSDVDDFIKYSLSVHNRRKSRVGYAFENHLEAIFNNEEILYTRGPLTEHRSKPDFLFPSIDDYFDDSFDTNHLTMLGVKSTCKDRWRQVLAEAHRIHKKHLITMEPAISESQLNEMRASELQLIVPKKILPTYSINFQNWVIDLEQFIDVLKIKQSKK